ncbi:MAG: ATPase [Candidatus Melainabacteria bacterium RIFCSPHIGHO2_02_FULL_34_12]|nr:MAG: ATPase [Candidatus Melainabacteria bacterium RIFCSPHIGHO2_02_FULL_34_12]
MPDIKEEYINAAKKIESALYEVKKIIVGQDYILERVLVGLLSDGHILLEGPPGLAKTLILKTFAEVMDLHFQRVQFTPDLLPSDLIGTQIYNQKNSDFETVLGPVFANLVLADEINRAPAKVQSALLEAMQEKQVTIAKKSHKIEGPFIVLATQNPIEAEGTYQLPEAQIDRFMFKLIISYPNPKEEIAIINRFCTEELPKIKKVISRSELLEFQKLAYKVYVDPSIITLIADIVSATRSPMDYKLESISRFISFGASPRASLNLTQASKALALIKSRDYVKEEDVENLIFDVLRHRVTLSYEGIMAKENVGSILTTILNKIKPKTVKVR